MLVALSIRSFVLIDRLDLEVGQGFTALTGETGAGKSIILGALGLVLGDPANRKAVRAGCDQASITAEFVPGAAHPVWGRLAALDVPVEADEALIIRRVVSAKGPSRAYINDQAVSTATLARIGETLVEIHGQHAATGLMRPSAHRTLLDSYGGLQEQVSTVRGLWSSYCDLRDARKAHEAAARAAAEQQDWLEFAVAELEKLAPEAGEVAMLLSQRTAQLNTSRLTEAIQELDDALGVRAVDESLAKAARAADRLLRIEGLAALDEGLARQASAAAEAVERVLIELAEAQTISGMLRGYDFQDGAALEQIEARLLALRAAARKFEAEPDDLAAALIRFREALELCETETGTLAQLKAQEDKAYQAWRDEAEALSMARKAAAKTLERVIMGELEPLHLGRVSVAVRFDPIGADEAGSGGLERVEFEVETNPGGGFGPLRQIASGGELARFSLALKCALAHAGAAETLIFDEADQGVGGAVAAAIGERLARLAADRQVFAITHSPQVASSAARQWRVRKQDGPDGGVLTSVTHLDEGQRLEEIARMLSGSSITDEARAAASKLLEVA